jgi:hypothetical protein
MDECLHAEPNSPPAKASVKPLRPPAWPLLLTPALLYIILAFAGPFAALILCRATGRSTEFAHPFFWWAFGWLLGVVQAVITVVWFAFRARWANFFARIFLYSSVSAALNFIAIRACDWISAGMMRSTFGLDYWTSGFWNILQ